MDHNGIDLVAIPPSQGSPVERFLAIVLLLALAGHFLAVLFTFTLQYYDTTVRSTRSPQPLAVYASALVGDWWFSLAYILSFLPGYLPAKRLAPHQPDSGPPILLVHGFLLNRACMFVTYWRLRRHGFQNIYTVNLHPLFGPLQETAANLVPRIREIVAHHDGRSLYVIAHSMGGVVLRKCLQHNPDLPIAKVVTLGTPHHGTGMANFGISAAAHELRPDSTFLTTLPPEPPVPFVSIYSWVDNIILPPDSAIFGERVIQFADVGHLSLLYSRRVFDTVLAELPKKGTGYFSDPE